jgi:hypothetical protein
VPGASEWPLQVRKEKDSQERFRLSFDKKHPLYAKYGESALQFRQKQLDLVVFDGKKPKDTLVFIKPSPVLKGKGFQETYNAYLLYGKYLCKGRTHADTITVQENGTIEGLEDFTSWDIGHTSGITSPRLIRTRSKITLGNGQTAKPFYMVMDPDNKSWEIFEYNRDDRGVYHLKLPAAYRLIPIID